MFDKAAPYCNSALKASGYREMIQYNPSNSGGCNTIARKKKRKIIWFNPPCSKNVHRNISNKFLRLLSKHLPKNYRLYKIFNQNNVKVSYIVKWHKQKILSIQEETEIRKCNCKVMEEWALQGRCLSQSLVCKAHITNDKDNREAYYIRLTERTFKDRLYKHRNSLPYRNIMNAMELWKYKWNLWDNNIGNAEIEWSILYRAYATIN